MKQYEPGECIGGEYKVLKVFGGNNLSGMGIVYLVQNREIPRPIVLKTFQRKLSEDAKRQFLSEAHAWISSGAHPNIVQAYWVREIAGQVFVAAEYIEPDEEDRNNLTHFLNAGQLRFEIILSWAVQFCHGMNYAKSKGVLAHRDIKPDNLMIDRAVTLKITDFGLAKSINLDAQPQQQDWGLYEIGQDLETVSKTMTGFAMGTLPYMAPEQFINAKGVDHRADIYSFGIILYQLASGNRYPYRVRTDIAEVTKEFFRAHTKQMPLHLESPLMPIIGQCLEKDPCKRYKTYDDLINDLNNVASELKIKLPKVIHVNKEDEELYAKAQSYVALGDNDRALNAIDEYVSKYPTRECGWTEKGRIHFERGEYIKGLTATRKSLDLNPYNTHAWNNLGILLNRTGAPIADIKKAFANALYFDPCNTAAMNNLIGPLVIYKEYEEAAAIIAKALKLRPDKPLVLQKAEALLKELFEENSFAAAEMLLSGWAEARPLDSNAWHNLGLIFINNRDPDRAIQCFAKVHEVSPEDNFAVVQLAKLYFNKKKARECLDYCNILLQRKYEPLLAVSLKSRVLNFVAGYDQALKFLQPYLDHNPENDALWVVLAEIHEYRENYDSAIKSLERAKRLLENNSNEHSREDLKFINDKIRQLSEVRRG